MYKMRKLSLAAMTLLLAFFASCGGGTSASSGSSFPSDSRQESDSGGNVSSGGEKDMTLAENYDFGDPSSWAGEQFAVTDLGDCLLDAYPYDDKYDWGQSILYDEEEKIYKMWWCRNSGYDTIWYAESSDLKNWHSAQKLMTVTEDSTWIKMHVGKPTVLKIDGKYTMYFEAPATLAGYKEFDNNVLMATSDDGISWEIWKGEDGGKEPYPVIRMTDEQMADSWDKSQLAGGSGYGYYGIGQPSALYKDGTYYLYCTYSLEAGDRMYVFTSRDGIHFGEGREVFTRAGSGVKYNTLTEKFMMAYEYTTGTISRVYYMESEDGVKFTYSNFTEASNNKNILSKGGGFVRGYPDFVGNGMGQVSDYTAYVAYMEGRMADAGNDWRQYSATWDIHIAAFNVSQYANRRQVLPNGRVYLEETIEVYRAAHEEYEERLQGVSLSESAPVIDGEKDALYDRAESLEIDRAVSDYRAVPGETTAKAYMTYTKEALYLFVDVKDKIAHDSDMVYLLLDEKRFASVPEEITNVEVCRSGKISATDGDSEDLSGIQAIVKTTNDGYRVEVMIPWRFKTTQEAYDSFGFDCYVYDNRDSNDFKSLLAWNDCHASYDIHKAGEVFFRKGN